MNDVTLFNLSVPVLRRTNYFFFSLRFQKYAFLIKITKKMILFTLNLYLYIHERVFFPPKIINSVGNQSIQKAPESSHCGENPGAF